MTIDQIKARRFYTLRGCPPMGGNPEVKPTRVRVLGYARDIGARRETWLRVRFANGGRLTVHPSALERETK